MTKLIAESDPEKCVNCIKWENQELILKKVKEELIKKRLCEVNKPEDVSTDETIKCSVCKENFSPRVQKSYFNNKLKNMDISANTYGSINPVVVINIVENNEGIDANVENGGVINEAFYVEDIPELDEDIDPNNLEKEAEDKEDVIYNASDKWRTSSKRSMSSVVSSTSTHIKTPTRRRSSAQASNASQKRRESIKNMLFGNPGLSGRRFSQDIRINEKDIPEEDETLKVIFLQVFVPFLIAGFGNVGAGIILDYVQYWDVFQTVTELFILVASFLGFKGNLEMTLAARLSTQANLGNLDKPSEQWKMGVGNVVLIQCQAIVVSFLAAIIAILVNVIKEWEFDSEYCFLICATSVITASVTGFFLSSLMIIVIIISRKAGVNPDNCSTLIAAFLGDISAVIMLAGTAKVLFMVRHNSWIAPLLIAGHLAILPFFIYIARKNQYTKDVIHKGWFPIIIAMFISSIGGFIFDFAVGVFQTIAIFQPIINGVGANLVAVQASRISTYLYQRCLLGEKPPESCEINPSICQLPHNVFIGSNTNVRTARLLIVMAIPGHIIYIITIRLIKYNEVSLTVPFVTMYLLVALVQVSILLYIAHVLVPFLWVKKIDPDSSAIPGIMATGDLIGTALLTAAFMFLVSIGDPNASNKFLEESI